MTVLVSDSFNRADSTTTLGSTDSYNGGTSQAWSFYNGGVWGISTNQAYTPTVHIDNTAYVTTQADNVTISLTVASSNIYINGIAFRIQDATHFFRAYATASSLKIDRNSGGSWTNIGSFSGSFSFPLAISITLSGSTITFNVGGVAEFSVTDTNYQTASNHGMYINNVSSSKLDNFEIDSNSAGTNTSITSVIANANASSLAPTIGTDNVIPSVVASAQANVLAPQVGSFTNINITATAPNATVSANNPSVSTTLNISLGAPISNAIASALVPNVGLSQSATISAVIASLVVDGIVPSISTSQGIQINSVVAGANATAMSPAILTDMIIFPTVAGAQAIALSPNINGKLLVSTIYLKANRSLTVNLNANQSKQVNLKGAIN